MAELRRIADGIWAAPGARIIDRTGKRRLPIGEDGFQRAIEGSVVIDKTMLIADVLDSGYKATLFCRPRRFGKTFNMTMLKAFFELPPEGESDTSSLFSGTEIWDARDGAYRAHRGIYPVMYLSLRTAKGDTWEQTYHALRDLIAAEFNRHDYLLNSSALDDVARTRFQAIREGIASESDYADALLFLARCLRSHHRRLVVLLVDEYDAPVMAAYSAPHGGYYRQAVSFLKRWLTGPLKDGGEVLAFACLTGVQRISKESIFSDLNNLTVSTALSSISDERFGFTEAEVSALLAYRGYAAHDEEVRRWYDGYRFGRADVFNPWSVLNYMDQGCEPDVYWGNTSGNSIIGQLVRTTDDKTLAQVFSLLSPGGSVVAPLDLGVVFPDGGAVPRTGLWSMLYLAGYLTTHDTAMPNNPRLPRRLAIPNREIAELYRHEIVERFAMIAGSSERLYALHRALASADADGVEGELNRIVRDAVSCFDITNENGFHMLMLGLCFGMVGYADPVSNREAGLGRFDIQLRPESYAPSSVWGDDGARALPITIELKYRHQSRNVKKDRADDALPLAAREALQQIARQDYDGMYTAATAVIRFGIACDGRRVAVAAESSTTSTGDMA